MADYAVAADEVGAWEKALGAGTTDTVTLTRSERGAGRGAGGGGVRVHLDAGTTALWVTLDGSAPADKGAKSYRVRPVARDYIDLDVPPGVTSVVVKVFSTGAVTYSVEGSR